MRRLARLWAGIDKLSEIAGRIAYWAILLMVLVGTYNAAARYAGRALGRSLTSNAYLELQWYLFSVLFLLGASYALRHGAHVRVDVFYGRFSPRTRAWMELLGMLLFVLPFCASVLYFSWPSVLSSWRLREMSPDPGGLPRYPIKTVILVGFLLLGLQAIAEAIKRWAWLRGRATPWTPPRAGEGL
ncbi:MAG: TRAP transporter small permease subunit [Bacteroidetes bacterium]|nr:TRAP transporter small permease subunit [Rhodothermia bacterium]MCS7155326.1 TRAP transporter small permease subunit [Bacteroidota bacterium]MCX7907581.1 TRAP transporter small permease subunit [Bacteroidota bacterium]MDW8138575.1 TRAP transporter small permease subunit [Bacteroidota bacterium]MDW8284488.1 TRAP transporter small permease subunit [Bacteroidota bacterium]